MDYVDLVKVAILGMVQGITEFLPISSTGHLILMHNFLNWKNDFTKTFFVVIQLGSMFAICWEYRANILTVIKRFFYNACNAEKNQRFSSVIIASLLPTVLIGLFFGDYIKSWFYSPIPVAIALIIGGIVILWVEYRQIVACSSEIEGVGNDQRRVNSLGEISFLDALKIGFVQSLALIPGTSRSAATIIGGLLLGFHRKIAVEFSFFLAIPLLAGAALFDFIKSDLIFLRLYDVQVFSVGIITTFFFSIFSVRLFLKYLVRHSFRFFAWYRIILGIVILITNFVGMFHCG